MTLFGTLRTRHMLLEAGGRGGAGPLTASAETPRCAQTGGRSRCSAAAAPRPASGSAKAVITATHAHACAQQSGLESASGSEEHLPSCVVLRLISVSCDVRHRHARAVTTRTGKIKPVSILGMHQCKSKDVSQVKSHPDSSATRSSSCLAARRSASLVGWSSNSVAIASVPADGWGTPHGSALTDGQVCGGISWRPH